MTRYTIRQLVVMVTAAAMLFYFKHLAAATVVCVLTLAVATLALVASELLRTFQQMGKRAGSWVGNGIGLLLLTLVYFTLFIPVGLLLRITRIDPLNRRFPTRGKSNWLNRIDYGEDKLLYKKSYTRPHTVDGSKR